MPERRCLDDVDPRLAFHGSRDGLQGARSVGYRTLRDARRGWALGRRAVWGRCQVGAAPLAAEHFDHVVVTAPRVACRAWQQPAFDPAVVLDAIDTDRRGLARFRRTRPTAAAMIADYLSLLDQYLSHLARWAAANPPGTRATPHPYHLVGGFYGDPQLDASGALRVTVVSLPIADDPDVVERVGQAPQEDHDAEAE